MSPNSKTDQNSTITEETLDPENWETVRDLAHEIIDDSLSYTRDVRERPVWQQMPKDTQAAFETPLPKSPTSLKKIYKSITKNVLPFPMGNIHPRFWMWYMGSSNFTGALGDFLAAIIGSNLGGGNHSAAHIDNQVINWFKEMIGFPPEASGSLVSGGSMANLLGLTVARNTMASVAGVDLREHGLAALKKPMRYYTSDQVHSCHQLALETLGLGNSSLRRISTNDDLTIDIEALNKAIQEDREAGFQPACVIATAGTVNTGAIDDLQKISALCHAEGLWFHVDGCIGALIAIAPNNKDRVAGIEKADSIAMDPHKWLHTPFEVGCVLIKSEQKHLKTFSLTPEYLEMTKRGIAAARWLHDFGLQTSRGFRALKVWMSLQEHGVEKFGRLIDQNIAQGQYLNDLIKQETDLELIAPTNINIVCYRYNPGGLNHDKLKEINIEIMLRLQEEGSAALSDTTVHGAHCLRVAITNHRTRQSDLDFLVDETLRIGTEILDKGLNK
ncbi:pyridoxal phosphate-dependent decarboxylase family protein [Kiloniella antarctica]|uniref:Pyridoxal phosphate-dependent decarboxylase family protein n=1 Tax=Kiloniella antarctica TaxID=1550907 RepID=A0ABW5BKD6_9PROT